MATVFELPLENTPQKFNVQLGAVEYTLVFKFNEDVGTWVMDILNAAGDTPILTGIPLVTGTDLLASYAYLGFTVGIEVQTDNDLYAVPTFDNLGSISHVYVTVN